MTTFSWLGITNSFNSPTNWTPNGTPGNGDAIIIPNNSLIRNQPSLGAADFTNTTFILGSALGQPADLTTGNFVLDTGSSILLNPGGVNFLGPSTNVLTFAAGSSVNTTSGHLQPAGPVINDSANLIGNFSFGTITNDGVITADNTIADFLFSDNLIFGGPVSGSGTIVATQRSFTDLANSVGSGQDIEFNGTSAYVGIAQPTNFAADITGFAPTDTIDVLGITADTGIFNNNTLTLKFGGIAGTTVGSLLVQGPYTSNQFIVSPSSVKSTITLQPPCFLAGTRIATPDGPVPVEHLAVGDRVVTAGGLTQPIVWIGSGRVSATRGQRTAATPVIVRKGAIEDNVPDRDLRITKGHSLYVDGVLVPVECLINHRTVTWDDHAQEVSLYHIELETHDVLLANGAPAESYRDDGNRWLFQNANTGWNQPAKPPRAPILMGGDIVDAIWRRLLERAGPRSALPLTDDPDLHLLVDGQRVDPAEQRHDVQVFRLTRRPRTVRIRSRAAIPQELDIARDPRPLGVAVRRIVLTVAGQTCSIAADVASLSDGYHDFEAQGGIRWTDGDAAVPDELFAGMVGDGTLALHLGAATRYLDEGTLERAA